MPRRPESISRLVGYVQSLSISAKFVLLYVIVFAVPIFIYAYYAFNNTTASMQAGYSRQSLDNLDAVFEHINRNIDTSETVIGTALDNDRFLEFIDGDMTRDDLALIGFKQNEYDQMVNLKNLNPTINNITFYMDNERIYELPPVLVGKAAFQDSELFDRLIRMRGREYFQINRDDRNAAGVPVHVVSLYRGITDHRQHEGVIEVNMQQNLFFQDLYDNPEEENELLLVLKADEPNSLLFNDNSAFYKKRVPAFADLTANLTAHTGKEKESYRFESSGERFAANAKYIRKMDAYLVQVYSLEGITGKIRDMRNRILIAVLVAISVLGIVTYALSSLLLKKLGVVVASMRRVQAGDLNVVVPVRGGDELDSLAGHFNHTLVKVKDLIAQLLAKELAVNEAENKALQSQINSHFVYNVLESIRMLAETEDKPDISEAVFSLGKMMRYSMKGQGQHVRLSEEAAMAGTYVTLMNIVSDTRVELTADIDGELQQCLVPKLSIEPLVENAVTHGIEPKGKDGSVAIVAMRRGDSLIVAVVDDGVGLDDRELARINGALDDEDVSRIELASKSGIGLFNVHRRIRLLYGKPYGISIASEKDVYTRVEMRLPYNRNIGGW